MRSGSTPRSCKRSLRSANEGSLGEEPAGLVDDEKASVADRADVIDAHGVHGDAAKSFDRIDEKGGEMHAMCCHEVASGVSRIHNARLNGLGSVAACGTHIGGGGEREFAGMDNALCEALRAE